MQILESRRELPKTRCELLRKPDKSKRPKRLVPLLLDCPAPVAAGSVLLCFVVLWMELHSIWCGKKRPVYEVLLSQALVGEFNSDCQSGLCLPQTRDVVIVRAPTKGNVKEGWSCWVHSQWTCRVVDGSTCKILESWTYKLNPRLRNDFIGWRASSVYQLGADNRTPIVKHFSEYVPLESDGYPRTQGFLLHFNLPFNGLESSVGSSYAANANNKQCSRKQEGCAVNPIPRYRHGGNFSDSYGFACITAALLGVCILVWIGADCLDAGRRLRGWLLIGSGIMLDGLAFASIGIGCLPWNWWACLHDGQQHSQQEYPHGDKVYHKKYLTGLTLCNTFSDMANVLPLDKQIAAVSALAEGSSIRSIERMTGIHRDTICRLGVRIGKVRRFGRG